MRNKIHSVVDVCTNQINGEIFHLINEIIILPVIYIAMDYLAGALRLKESKIFNFTFHQSQIDLDCITSRFSSSLMLTIPTTNALNTTNQNKFAIVLVVINEYVLLNS